MTKSQAIYTLSRLPAERLAVLVVRSMPFGDIIYDDTREVVMPKQDTPTWRVDAYEICIEATRIGGVLHG
ncbi:MAG: hypothetical protein IPL32_18595 [Chloracidobacterium sp.]|nr:hypothetical protein [Chloracidobacterium sp.]